MSISGEGLQGLQVRSGFAYMGNAANYLKILDFFQCENVVFDKPTSFFFMVGGLWVAIRGVPGDPIL